LIQAVTLDRGFIVPATNGLHPCFREARHNEARHDQGCGLKPDDFPIEADKDKLRTQKGEPVASAESDEIADQIAERLNEHAHQEEQDRWSA
jgi:hypothetical protein